MLYLWYWCSCLSAPPPWPMRVTALLSPPNAAICSCTHCSASLWSCMSAFWFHAELIKIKNVWERARFACLFKYGKDGLIVMGQPPLTKASILTVRDNPNHRLINYKDIKPWMMSLLLFNRVYRLEIQSVLLVFLTGIVNYCPSNLFSG